MKKYISVTVRDKIATADPVRYVCGNASYVLSFDFDQEWGEYEHKTARFIYNGTFSDVVFSGNECPVPIISNTYHIYVGVFAGDLCTTTPAYIPATKSILCDNPPPADPVPGVYNQIMDLLNELKEVSREDVNRAIQEYITENASAENILQNGGFDDTTMWVVHSNSVKYTSTLDLAAGNLYCLRFRARSNAEGTAVYARIGDFDANGVPMSLNNRTVVGTEWTDYEYRFVPNVASAYKLEFVSPDEESFSIDNISLVDCGVASANDLYNPEFDWYGGEPSNYTYYDWCTGTIDYKPVSGQAYSGKQCMGIQCNAQGAETTFTLEQAPSRRKYFCPDVDEVTFSAWLKSIPLVEGTPSHMKFTVGLVAEDFKVTWTDSVYEFDLTNEWERYEFTYKTPDNYKTDYRGLTFKVTLTKAAPTGTMMDLARLHSTDVSKAGGSIVDKAHWWTVNEYTSVGTGQKPDGDPYLRMSGWTPGVRTFVGGYAHPIMQNVQAQTYKLSFWAKASSLAQRLFIHFDEYVNGIGYTKVKRRFDLTPEWKQYEAEFVINEGLFTGYTHSRMNFIGWSEKNHGATIYVDDIRLIELADKGLVTNDELTEARAFAEAFAERMPYQTGEFGVRVTVDQNKSVLQKVLELPECGFYTVYVENGCVGSPKEGTEFRGFAHLTDNKSAYDYTGGNIHGYIVLFDNRGIMHTQYIKNGEGKGWRSYNDKADGVPDYWLAELDSGVQAINTALCKTGANKSAFLFYTDAHWNKGSQMSPTLLKYLYQNTGMAKTFFGGDIVNNEADDYDTMAYLWDWRKQVKDLPNHHSVVGNHDDGNTTNNLFNEKYVYGYLLAAEETCDVVRGENGLYYYVDNPAEKTRYLCLDTAFQSVYYHEDQKEFVTDALLTTPDGWHIVAIAHIWHDTDYTVEPPAVSGLSNSGEYLLSQFDNYNSRTGVFAECGGWVEFCIGGHTHWDYDSVSATGIPVILVETDSWHVRSGLDKTAGTTNEASVNGIIADYDAKKIHVVRIGRGESREITVTTTIITYTNLLPSAVGFDGNVLDGVGYAEGSRYSTSSPSISRDAVGAWDCTGLMPVTRNSDGVCRVYLKDITMYYSAEYDAANKNRGCVAYYDESYAICGPGQGKVADIATSADFDADFDSDGNIVSFVIPNWSSLSAVKYFGICAQDINADSIITVNEPTE